jgi:glycosyltransferase involved in cell wall biosynthesis
MKIAFIGQKGIPARGGGVERYVEDLSVRLASPKLLSEGGLASENHEVVVYTRSHYTPKDLKNYQGVKLVNLPSWHSKHADAITHTILASIHATFSRVEVIHFQSIGPALVAWLPKLLNPKIKIVSTLQSRDYEHQKWGAFARLMLKLGERIMCAVSDEVIVVTRLMENYVKEKYDVIPHYIPNGANLYQEVDGELIAQWGLAKDNYIVAISRLVRHKGLSYLIKAYQDLGATDKKLVIVGDGAFTDGYVQELKDLAQGNDNIIFTGNQTGQILAELYANAYLFVQPSESEGLSLALLEAMSRRVPVLVSDIPENKEAVNEVGFLFKNKDTNDLLEKLRFLLNEIELVKDRGLAGRELVEVKFNWDIIAKDILAVYEQALLTPRHVFVRKQLKSQTA